MASPGTAVELFMRPYHWFNLNSAPKWLGETLLFFWFISTAYELYPEACWPKAAVPLVVAIRADFMRKGEADNWAICPLHYTFGPSISIYTTVPICQSYPSWFQVSYHAPSRVPVIPYPMRGKKQSSQPSLNPDAVQWATVKAACQSLNFLGDVFASLMLFQLCLPGISTK